MTDTYAEAQTAESCGTGEAVKSTDGTGEKGSATIYCRDDARRQMGRHRVGG
jgi:hypothetical protein